MLGTTTMVKESKNRYYVEAVGLRSVAAPIRDRHDYIVAAINISVPSVRVSRQELVSQLAPMVTHAAQDICLALGAAP